jgi:hypothetical protein
MTFMTAEKQKKVGEFAGVPYDWDKPTVARFKSHTWNPEAPLITKRYYGWGYDFNFYVIVHPFKWHRSRTKTKE